MGFTKEEADLAEVQEARERLGAAGFERAGGVLPQGVAEALTAGPVNCRTYWPSPYRVCGAIREKYEALGGPASFLTWPKSDELGVPDGVGRRNEFVNGFIYWHPDTGAHAVSTHFSWVWNNLGWESGPLGYPVEDEVAVGDGLGRKQVFQGGHIYGSLAGLGSVRGRILERWLEFGGPTGELGYPVGDEAGTPDGRGRFSRFTDGMMYWTPQTDAWPIKGAFQFIFESSGHETGEYGYPISNVYFNGSQDLVQDFTKKQLNLGDIVSQYPDITLDGKQISSAILYLTDIDDEDEKATPTSPAWAETQSRRPLRVPGIQYVSVIPTPSYYVYNPSWGSLNDFCTKSPDQYPPVTALTRVRRANFEGPCAIHDMCYQAVSRGSRTQKFCDERFHSQLLITCEGTYHALSTRRYRCGNTAQVYYQAVKRVPHDF